MKLEQVTGATIAQLWTTVEPHVQEAASLEEAAQALVTALRMQFTESVVLARIYATVPFDDLPPTLHTFVQELAESAGAAAALKATTPVLSLLGTNGQEDAWSDRRNSSDHKGIPMISAEFVSGIPMISRLLCELGVPLDWINSHEAQRIVTTIGNTVGLFFVQEAAQAKDEQGRQVIPAQDFVSTYEVKSVFGTGGGYPDGQILVLVVFCRDEIARTTADLFMPLADLFRGKTASLVDPAKVFASD